jgi:hypothetical protein
MYQALFVIFAVSGAAYFLFKRRGFDYYTVAFFSAIIYFLPGFFGYTTFHTGGIWRETPLHSEAYLIMTAVIASILLSAVIASRVKNPVNLNIAIPAPAFIVHTLLFLSLFGAIALTISAGSSIHDADKDVVMENLGRWHILFYSSATIGLPLSFTNKQYRLSFIFLALLVFDLYLGFRSSIAMASISVLALHLATQSRSRLALKEFKILFLIGAIGAFFFLYKSIAFATKSGMWDVVFETLSNSQTYGLMITRSEPFIIQQILNQVIIADFQTSIVNVFGVFSQIILFGPDLGLDSPSFNSLFQPTLFPSVEYGMASNIWAQMWSAGGWTLLLVFIIIFNVVLSVGNATLKSSSSVVRAGLAPIFLYWAFYIHRNDLSYAVNIEKRMLLILGFCILLAYTMRYLRRGRIKSIKGIRSGLRE